MKTKFINSVYKKVIMCPTISLRISAKIKSDLDHYKSRVDWNYELRQYIEKKIEIERKKDLLEKLESMIEELEIAKEGTAEKLVREDRDSH
jgi:hypothetical protein